jgi:hypothetical protein
MAALRPNPQPCNIVGEGPPNDLITCGLTTCPCSTGLACKQMEKTKRKDFRFLRNALAVIRSKIALILSKETSSTSFRSDPTANPVSGLVRSNVGDSYAETTVTPSTINSGLSVPLTPCSEGNRGVHSSTRKANPGVRTIHGMRIFNREVEDIVIQRFRVVQDALEPSLIVHLCKSGVNFRPMGMQLLVLGHDERNARPWIVFHCSKPAKKVVEQFCQLPFAQNICQQNDSREISFEVAVIGWPLQPTSGGPIIVVFTDDEQLSHYPFRLKINHAKSAYYATMGGFVNVYSAEGEMSVLGMTAGHVLPPEKMFGIADSSLCNEQDTNTSSLPPDDTLSDTEGVEDYVHIVCNEQSVDVHSQVWSYLGAVSSASFSDRACDRDWALIELHNIPAGRPDAVNKMSTYSYEAGLPKEDRRALLCNNTTQHCEVSRLPARALLPSGKRFVDVHILQLPENKG